MWKLVTTVAVGLMAATMIQASVGGTVSAKPSSVSKKGVAVAFAKVNIATAEILTFGGKGTEDATATGDHAGYADIKFTGHYPKNITGDQVIVIATCQSNDWGVANAMVMSESPTELLIRVYGWSSSTLAYNGETVFVSVMLGR